MLAFCLFCLGFGGFFESLSLRTGFPFGHYYFTDVMGPKLFQLPILLVLAYVGIGYLSWVLSLLILGYRNKVLTGVRVVATPMLASFVMVAWDLSMEADWATIDRAWIWRDGGAFFGVPVSNFFGWFLTTFLFYQAFALYCRKRPRLPAPLVRNYWRVAIIFYGVCAAGNLLILRVPMAPSVVTDASGRQWMTMDILGVSMLTSLLVMLPLALLAWLRLKEQEADEAKPSDLKAS
jgi:putative membrane protein